jgi:hypothetical protein
VEILEFKNRVPEMKNSLKGLKSRSELIKKQKSTNMKIAQKR